MVLSYTSSNNNFSLNNNTSFYPTTPADIGSCLAYFNFNTSGTYNYSTNLLFNGSATGTLLFTEGRVGSCYQYDGTQKITVPTVISGINQEFSSCAWVYPTTISGAQHRIWISTIDRTGIAIGNSKFNTYVYDTTYRSLTPNNIPKLNTWQHVANTYKNNYLSLYLDGNKIGSLFVSGPIVRSVSAYVGNWSSNTQGFKGKIDEVAFYDRALSQVEIQQLYNLGYTKFNTFNSSTNNLTLSGANNLLTLNSSDNQIILQGGEQ